MRKSKFTDSQIVDAVKRVEAGFGVPDICRELGISTATSKTRKYLTPNQDRLDKIFESIQ